MTTKSKENKEAYEALDRLSSSVNKLVDDVHVVKVELAKFKQDVQHDIQRLVDLREKDVNAIREQFTKK